MEGASQATVLRGSKYLRNHRLIIELSYIEGHSINDGLEPKLCTMKHTFVVAVVATVLAHGTST